jgi:hypothetical protein
MNDVRNRRNRREKAQKSQNETPEGTRFSDEESECSPNPLNFFCTAIHWNQAFPQRWSGECLSEEWEEEFAVHSPVKEVVP